MCSPEPILSSIAHDVASIDRLGRQAEGAAPPHSIIGRVAFFRLKISVVKKMIWWQILRRGSHCYFKAKKNGIIGD
jgi:hypothetical protein